jgi:endonuclease-3 related protein
MGTSRIINQVYRKLHKTFGTQNWWPGDGPLEIMVGAVLTQNTNWTNVEKAIKNLKKEKVLSLRALRDIKIRKLARIIKPCGYYNIKAKRLKNLINFIFTEYSGSLKKLFSEDKEKLRERLLSVNGIGKETADSIMCYAGKMEVFVIDAYTKRVFYRLGVCPRDIEYDEIQEVFYKNLKKDYNLYNEYHALIVRLAQNYCKPKPICKDCPIKEIINVKCKTDS